MRDQRGAPGVARLGIAQRVELERHTLDAQLAQQLVGEHEQLDIGRGFGRADDLGVELVELAEAALLGTLVTEHRAAGDQLDRRILLPALGDVRAADARGEFGTQRDQVAALVLERVHLLRDDVAGLAHRAREHAGRLEDGDVDALEAIEFADVIEGLEHAGEPALLLAKDVLGAADAVGRFDACHWRAPIGRFPLRRNAKAYSRRKPCYSAAIVACIIISWKRAPCRACVSRFRHISCVAPAQGAAQERFRIEPRPSRRLDPG
jgi:hypothetical protein